jgi:5,5'-dehydrodivanillate O-demethylase oxygenase subunit
MDTTDYPYAGPGTLMGRILRQYWQPVATTEEVDQKKALPTRIMSEDLTVYKGESGQYYVVDFRCAHRGTQLSTGWVEGECIRCFYHGWKYDGTGQCVEQPAEDATFAAKVKIKSYPTQAYAGLVFAYFGEGEPPPMWRHWELERDYGVKWTEKKLWDCNWFQRLENAIDGSHLAFVHSGSEFGQQVSGAMPEFEYEETEWGMRLISKRPGGNTRINELHFPNVIHIRTPVLTETVAQLPWSDLFNWYTPVDDTHSVLFTSRCAPLLGEDAKRFEERLPPHRYYNPADEHDMLMANPREADHRPDPVSAQDYVAQLGQGAIADRINERLGRGDAGIVFARGLFRREMAKLERGLPLKQWVLKPRGPALPVPPGVPDAPDMAAAR